jgi:hypothetical protein
MLWAGILNFKFRIVFGIFFFLRFEKRIALSEKKPLKLVHCTYPFLSFANQNGKTDETNTYRLPHL